jgi:uncharacterized protein YhfF
MATSTPLPDIDQDSVVEFWSRCSAAGLVAADSPLPAIIEPFGDSAELADELLDLIIYGPKRATAASYDEAMLEEESLPVVGELSIVTDGAGRARALLRTTDVRVGPLSSVDKQFAWDEGEDDRTRDSWLRVHHEFFRRYLPTVGLMFDDDMPTVFERFELLHAE